MKAVPAAPIVAIFSLAIAVAAAWMAVGTQSWAQTILIAGIGGVCLLFPPSGAVPKPLLAIAGLLLLLAATAFLPAVPGLGTGFRQPFLDQGIQLPGTLSPQPWWSLEDITLLVSTLLWAWYCLETRLSGGQREFLFSAYGMALAVVAVAVLLSHSPWGDDLPAAVRTLGQFENRNQTGDLLVMGGLVAFVRALGDLAHRRLSGLFWIVLLALFLAAILRNDSRAAFGLLMAGLVLCYVLVSKNRNRNWIVGLVVLVAAVAGMFIIALMGNKLLERGHLLFVGGGEGRFNIYRDAAGLVARQPLHGVTLGNFEAVYNIERQHTATEHARSIHPESDWMWVATELGVGGVILFALLLGLVFRSYFQSSPFPRLTQVGRVVGILFLVHSLFDVSGHRLGTMWSCLYLVGLGAYRPVLANDLRVSPWILRIAGLALLLLAGLRVQSLSLQPWMPTRGSLARAEEVLRTKPPPEKARQILNQSLGWAPLHWPFYYQRALLDLAAFNGSGDGGSADFNRALFLEQNSIKLAVAVGDVCRNRNRPEAMIAWKETLRRTVGRQKQYFTDLYIHADVDSKLRLDMFALAEGDPDLETIAIIYQNPSEFDWMLHDFLGRHPGLRNISPDLLRQLFDKWGKNGDAAELIRLWPAHPEWQQPGWRGYAHALAQTGRYDDAVKVVLQSLPEPALPHFPPNPDVEKLGHQFQGNPRDAYLGIQLYFAQAGAGDQDAALATLNQLAALSQHPPYVSYLLARTLSALNQNEDAWKALKPLLEQP